MLNRPLMSFFQDSKENKSIGRPGIRPRWTNNIGSSDHKKPFSSLHPSSPGSHGEPWAERRKARRISRGHCNHLDHLDDRHFPAPASVDRILRSSCQPQSLSHIVAHHSRETLRPVTRRVLVNGEHKKLDRCQSTKLLLS
jgi:hypothetical protein